MGFKSEGTWVPRQHHHILDMYYFGRIYALGFGAGVGDCQAWKIVLETMEAEGERLVEGLAAGQLETDLGVEAGAMEEILCMRK